MQENIAFKCYDEIKLLCCMCVVQSIFLVFYIYMCVSVPFRSYLSREEVMVIFDRVKCILQPY